MKKSHSLETIKHSNNSNAHILKAHYLRIMIFISIIIPLLASCSSGPPESFLKQNYQEYLDKKWPGSCQIIEFKVLNSFKPSNSDTVQIKYYAKIEIVNDVPNNGYGNGGMHICGIQGIHFLKPRTFQCPDFEKNPFQAWNPKDYKIKKGFIFETIGNNSWTKTVNGWE